MLYDVYERLLNAYGPQGWWPGESAFEVLVGTVLVQNTAWRNVEQAVANLRREEVLAPRALHALPQHELEELIRPAGYFRLKARRLRNLLNLLIDEHGGDLDSLLHGAISDVRERLLRVNGVGPETADSILLYAGGLPAFVVDTYTARVMKRHGWIEPEADYHALQEHFVGGLAQDVSLFNEFHALLVKVGHLHCRPTPRCDGCPLQPLLPECGVVELQ